MHGHGYAPPQPGRPADGTLVALRTLFVALTVLSCGFLAWAPLLRLAVITREVLDWVLFCVALLSTVGMFVFLWQTVPEDEKQEMSDGSALTFLGWMLITILGVTIYYLVAEIRHYGRAGAPAAAFVPPGTTGYGYPPPAPQAQPAYAQPVPPRPPHSTPPPAPVPALPQQSHPQPQSQPHLPPQPQQVPQQTPPRPQVSARPTSQRIDQVRAELDELSDLLRREPQDPWEQDR
ncbi:hypothetical protein [Streptomyces lavendofoliae]|uniref:hypothetical protein n=1 Tax=Streptomyces lavendofoliae TaxID=67314 RepID=UPI00300F77BF